MKMLKYIKVSLFMILFVPATVIVLMIYSVKLTEENICKEMEVIWDKLHAFSADFWDNLKMDCVSMKNLAMFIIMMAVFGIGLAFMMPPAVNVYRDATGKVLWVKTQDGIIKDQAKIAEILDSWSDQEDFLVSK